jgi:hypothetical protein
MPKHPVGKELARTAKAMLYVGRPQAHVAAVLGISQASVSRLKSGTIHEDVPWPSGDLGAIPRDTRQTEKVVKWSETAALFQAYPEELQIRIFEIVNVRRAAVDLPPIPPLAPEYQQYLESQDEEGEEDPFEFTGVERAQIAEDRRVCQLMKEFDDVLEEETAQQRCEEIFAVLAATRGQDDPRDVPQLDTPQTPLIYRKMSWEDVCEVGGRVGVVQKAIGGDDPALCEACCIVFYELRNSVPSWKSASVEEQIYRIRDRLKSEPGKIEELRRNYGL